MPLPLVMSGGDVDPDRSLGDGDSGDAEESFAYLAGGITAVISNRVWDYLQATAA